MTNQETEQENNSKIYYLEPFRDGYLAACKKRQEEIEDWKRVAYLKSNTCDSLKDEIDRLRADNEKLKDENDSLKEKYKSASENVTRLGDMCNDWKRQYDELESKLRISEMERVPVEIYDELKAENERLNNRIKAHESGKEYHLSEIDRLKDLAKRAKPWIIDGIESELAQQKALLDEAVKEIEYQKELKCDCGNHYIAGKLESYKCEPCAFLERVKK